MRWLAVLIVLASAVAQEAGPYRIGGGISAPVVVYKVEPAHPEEGRGEEFEGTVGISIVVDEEGKPRDLKIIRSVGPELDQKALEAVQQWRFKPGMRRGYPVAVQAYIEVNFRIPKSASWHLSDISYKAPEGASDPLLVSEKYPPNAGPGTTASVTLSFDVDEQGVPMNLHVEKSSDQKWEADVIAAVREWRFSSGLLDFKPVLVPCTVSLVLGEVSAPSVITPPQLIQKVEPKYTKEAEKAKLAGTVTLLVVVDQEGRPRDLRVTKPLGLGLDEKALEAVRQWRFQPGIKDGKPVAVQVYIQVSFRIR